MAATVNGNVLQAHLDRLGLTFNDQPTSMTGLSFPGKMNILIFYFRLNDSEQLASDKGLH